MRRFAISDIHGCLKTFRSLLQSLALTGSDELFLLGDFIDRGPESRLIIEEIFSLRAAGRKVICLLGNHEQMLLEAIEREDALAHWRFQGGDATLKSYGCLY